MPMNRNSSRICGRKTSTRAHAAPHAVDQQRPQHGVRHAPLAAIPPEDRISHCTPSISGRAPVKMVWNTAPTTTAKISGPRSGCRKTRVQAAGPHGRSGRAVARLRPMLAAHSRHAARPAAPAARTRLRRRRCCPARNSRYRARRLRPGRADQRHRRAELLGQRRRIHVAAAPAQIVGHVQDHQRRQAQARIGAASIRWRLRLVESRISSDGVRRLGRPGILPCSTSCETCSSSERGDRL